MEAQTTPYEQTMKILQARQIFFKERSMRPQNALAISNPYNYSVRSLSELFPSLCQYFIHQTPVHMNLADLYVSSEKEDELAKFILPPVSEGEDSITQDQYFEPSFKWVASALIDSTCLVTDHIEPKKVERGRISPEWKGVNELLIYNVDKKIYLRQQMQQIEEHLKSRFDKYPWIKHKRCRQIYYKGKPSFLVKFNDETSASFAYFNLSTSTQKAIIGTNMEVLRVIENKTKQKINLDVTLIFRKLPLSMTKQTFLALFKKGQGPTWVQDLIQINGYKYTFARVASLNDAFTVVTAFLQKNIKEAKVNYHPKSAKLWRVPEQTYMNHEP